LKKYCIARKYLTVGIILLVIGTCVISAIAQKTKQHQSATRGNIWYVGGSGLQNYTKIQDAIDNASEGDTVFVYSGTYYENIAINKSIIVVGEDRGTTFILGENDTDIIKITDCSILLTGFTIQKFHEGVFSGIYMVDCWSSQVSQNNILSCEIGILLTSSESILISHNLIRNCSVGVLEVITGNITVTENRIEGNWNGYGVWMEASMFRNYISRNSITNNSIGIYLFFTLFSNIQENNFFSNQQQAFFANSFFTKWQQNYWNHTRLFPKVIIGGIGTTLISQKMIPFFNVDWKPAEEPFNIEC
jgi:parallel beta-helix repeat protein